jgi:hypothetical protein
MLAAARNWPRQHDPFMRARSSAFKCRRAAADSLSVRIASPWHLPQRTGGPPDCAEPVASEPVLPLLAGLAFMGGVIHVGAAVDHAAEVPLYTPAFLVVATAQLGWAWLLWRGPSRAVLLAGAGLSVGVLLVWLASRTVGVPFGPHPWVPEEVSVADLVESADELAAALVAIVLVWHSATQRRWVRVAQPAMLALLLVSLLYGVGAHAG